MTTAAMKVFPSPVGKETSVFWKSAPLVISSWYCRSAYFSEHGQIHVMRFVGCSGGSGEARPGPAIIIASASGAGGAAADAPAGKAG